MASIVFVAGRRMQRSLEESLAQGMLNSASVICHEDTQTGLLSNDTLAQKLAGYGLGNIQRFRIC